jgi:hypothetical protein
MSLYPEQVPSEPFDHFLFSFSSAAKVERELQEEFDALTARINNIVESDKFFIQGFPVLKNILALQPSKSDLKKLSKAVDRLSDLMEIFTQLNSKLTMIKTMQEHPHWFTNTFADFAKEVERDIDVFMQTIE